MGRRASAGEGRRPGGSSIQLHPSAGGGMDGGTWSDGNRSVGGRRLGREVEDDRAH
jgi:hypothetical protein